MKNLSKKQKIIILATLLILGIAIFWLLESKDNYSIEIKNGIKTTTANGVKIETGQYQ